MTQKKLPGDRFAEHVRAYWRDAVRAYQPAEATEHSGRSPLEQLFRSCTEVVAQDFITIHEPKQKERKAPDFAIKRGALFIGYAEVKKPLVNLAETLLSEQIEGYLELSENMLVTNYHSWALYRGRDKEGKKAEWGETIKLGDLNEVSSLEDNAVIKLCDLLEKFFTKEPTAIGDIETMAKALALRAKQLKEALLPLKMKLEGLYYALQKQVASDLTIDVFKDAYAQIVVYGLLLAKLNAGNKEITLTNAREHITASFPVIKELTEFLYELRDEDYDDTRLYVEEILAIINNLDLAAIKEQMTFKYWQNRQKDLLIKDEETRLFARDPFVYFYEDFLKAYDSEKRQARGVYFTPPPIVSFIVKSIEEILRDKKLFGINKGLSDPKRVTLLDFATGTGTFLAEVIRIVLDKEKHQGNKNIAIEEHILKNIYGFEFLIAPYVAAHLKLSQVLKEYDYVLHNNQEIPVYLTNTLEEKNPQEDFLLPALSAETKKAHRVKEKPILVITGNPPYKGKSENKGEWITRLIAKYRQNSITNGHGIEDTEYLGERNPKWLQDDYVKFIAFAQDKINRANEGIVAIITNHAFIDNPTFRFMRQSLMDSFERIYILNLHGNYRRKEVTPGGDKDENIFDIMQGVAISFFIKKRDTQGKPLIEKGIYHAELWGTRKSKYRAAFDNSWKTIAWKKIKPDNPFHLFIPRNIKNENIYNKGWALRSIFPINSAGIITARDRLTIQFSAPQMLTTVKTFARIEEKEAFKVFSLPKDAQDWKVSLAQENVKKHGITKKLIKPIDYRVFDRRYIYYTPETKGFLCRPRYDLMRHMLNKNVSLVTCRHRPFGAWRNVFITENLLDIHFSSYCDYLFPLYLYCPAEGEKKVDAKPFGGGDIFKGQEKIENISAKFRNFIDERYPEDEITAEQILAYIYAILHDQEYRQKFQEFLKYDFPRIPFPERHQYFTELAKLGQELIDAHLLKGSSAPDRYVGKSNSRKIEKIRFDPSKEHLYINNDNYFKDISATLYDFHIGGYKVLEKYLKEREKRKETIFGNGEVVAPATLTAHEISHISNIANALDITQRAMQEITEKTTLYEIYKSS